ncbi:unnamed protein product [Paramecium sonneborni]|uniref:WD40-repeat-containing domain n=1 Tax=Paramecium sonneborni TaxID=65129 RepID=A0A8S1MGK9_9CILI|nr:unnamed protein product [Paramecium sonneborni]
MEKRYNKKQQIDENSVFKNNTRIIQTLVFAQKSNMLMVGSDDRLIQIFVFQYKKWSLKFQEKQDYKLIFICSPCDNDFISYQIKGQYEVWKSLHKNKILVWEKIKGYEEGKIKKLSFLRPKNYQLKVMQVQSDGNKQEINIDQKNGDLLVMSYLSPSQSNNFIEAQQQQFKMGTFKKFQSKFAILAKNKLQVYIEDID